MKISYIAILVFSVLTSNWVYAADTVRVPFKTKDATSGMVDVTDGVCTEQELFQLVQFATYHSTHKTLDVNGVVEEVQDFCGTPRVRLFVTHVAGERVDQPDPDANDPKWQEKWGRP